MKSAQDKILTYLLNHPSGVSGSQIEAWLDSCAKGGGYTYAEMCDAKRALRDSGRIACTNGNWWLKDIPTATKEATEERSAILKQRLKLA